jgi:hypothetical protein
VPVSIFESDGDAERAGVYRRSHAAKYYDDTEDRLVARAVAPEFSPPEGAPAYASSSASAPPEFTVKVVNGVAQVVTRAGPGLSDAAAAQAAALRSDSLLVAPLKAQLKGKGREGGAFSNSPDGYNAGGAAGGGEDREISVEDLGGDGAWGAAGSSASLLASEAQPVQLLAEGSEPAGRRKAAAAGKFSLE